MTVPERRCAHDPRMSRAVPAEATPSNETFYICARNQTSDTFATGRITIVHFGSALTAGEVAAARLSFANYLAGVGAI